jgi:hypothetical protein
MGPTGPQGMPGPSTTIYSVNANDFTGADMGAKINAAITALGTTGGMVLVPRGTYSFSTPIVADDTRCITIMGVGGQTAGAAAATRLIYTATSGTPVSARTTTSFRLRDIQIVVNHPSYTGTVVDTSHSSTGFDSSWVVIEGCSFFASNGASPDIIIDLNQTINSTIRNNTFHGSKIGIRGKASSSSYSNVINIEHNNFSSSTGDISVAMIQNPGEAWRISNNTFEMGTALGEPVVIGFVDGVTSKGLLFEANWVGDNTASASQSLITLCDGSQCHGNFLASAGTGTATIIAIPDSTEGVSITGNHFQNAAVVFAVGTGVTGLHIEGNEYGIGIVTFMTGTPGAGANVVDNAATPNRNITGPVSISGTLTLGTALPISSGGTGATTAAAARTALGVPQLSGSNIFIGNNHFQGVLNVDEADFQVARSGSTNTNNFTVQNGSGHAVQNIQVGSANTIGNPYTSYLVGGLKQWITGIERSTQQFRITASSTFGVGDAIAIAPATHNVMVGGNSDNGTDKLQVAGSVSATDVKASGALTVVGQSTFTHGISGGDSAILAKVDSGQAAIDLWSNTPSGATPAGGSHWRIFADNVGGGGDATCGFFDLANGRLAMGLDNNGGVVIPRPDLVTLGSGWVNWLPSFSGGGSMTLADISVNYAKYIRIGPLVYFRIYFGVTFGGTISTSFSFSLPFISSVDGGGHTQLSAAFFQGAGWVPSVALALSNDNQVLFNSPVGSNVSAGTAFVSVSGFYSCA